jgi:hypothetical protein
LRKFLLIPNFYYGRIKNKLTLKLQNGWSILTDKIL